MIVRVMAGAYYKTGSFQCGREIFLSFSLAGTRVEIYVFRMLDRSNLLFIV